MEGEGREKKKHLLPASTSFVLRATSCHSNCPSKTSLQHDSRFNWALTVSSPCLFKYVGGTGFSLLMISEFSNSSALSGIEQGHLVIFNWKLVSSGAIQAGFTHVPSISMGTAESFFFFHTVSGVLPVVSASHLNILCGGLTACGSSGDLQSFETVGLDLTYATSTVLYWPKQSQVSPDLR